jgi:hypothetical protein
MSRAVRTEAAAPHASHARGGAGSFGLGRLLRWWLATGTLLLLAIVAFVAISGVAFDFEPLHIAVSGDDFLDGIQVTGLTLGAKALIVAGVLVIVLVVLLVAPLVLVLLFAAVTLAVVASLLGMAIALAVGTAPLWIVGLAVWWNTRRRRRIAAAFQGARQ